jgi:hypothetical protein
MSIHLQSAKRVSALRAEEHLDFPRNANSVSAQGADEHLDSVAELESSPCSKC